MESHGPGACECTHGVGMRPTAITETTMNIVESLGAIHTHADHDAVALEALRPLIVDQRGIGLHVLFDRHALLLEVTRVVLEATGRFVVEPAGKGEGFSGMPEDRQLRPPIGALVDPVEQQRELIKVKLPALLAIRQIAVTAIEIAKRRGLDHHQADGTEISAAHQFANPPR